jgi:hypothetical protein
VAFVVETGAGLATATSYVSVAFANAYHAGRRQTAWTGGVADKEAALIKATEYIDVTMGANFYGEPKNAGYDGTDPQALAWPRVYAYDEDTGREIDPDSVPIAVQQATCEIALVALTEGTLFPASDATRTFRRREVAGRVEIDTWTDGVSTDFPLVRLSLLKLRPLMRIAGGAMPINRV